MGKNYLFVYGTLKEGHGNNRLLEGSKKIGVGITKKKFGMYSRHIPYVVDDEETTNIKGELYEISNSTLSRCDLLEGHPRFYERKLIDVIVDNTFYKAWCYINNNIHKNDMKNVLSGEYY